MWRLDGIYKDDQSENKQGGQKADQLDAVAYWTINQFISQ